MTIKNKQSKGSNIYQLKITLKDSKPPIWRRLQVKSDITLSKLHQIFQVAMGWSNTHLHQFIIHGVEYGIPDPDYDTDIKDERYVKLGKLLVTEGEKFTYEYDFGDNWEHEILIEKILPMEISIFYPICIKGKRACPPEDCGGIWGYLDFLEAIEDISHPEHDEILEWAGGEFNPAAFEVNSINQELKQLGYH
ncbi:MAG: plasmid pRiA4b ORF-3 family protein [bacterium]